MTTQNERERGDELSPLEARWAWKGGILAGLIATVAMGLVISVMQISTLRVAIAGLYGFEGNLAAGWVAHLVHGALFGSIFAAILSDPGLHRVPQWLWKSVVAGVVYGLVLAIAGAGIIMPMWLSAVGFSDPPSMPHVTLPLLVWHVIYGTFLGALFPFVENVR